MWQVEALPSQCQGTTGKTVAFFTSSFSMARPNSANVSKSYCKASLYFITVLPDSTIHGRMNYKDTKPYMSAFLSVDLLTDFAAFCLTDFIDWRYIHSWFVFSTQACELLPHGRRNYTCVLLPLYCTFSLTSSPLPPFPM
jgi:hypothetical protein